MIIITAISYSKNSIIPHHRSRCTPLLCQMTTTMSAAEEEFFIITGLLLAKGLVVLLEMKLKHRHSPSILWTQLECHKQRSNSGPSQVLQFVVQYI
jgi:hypothetical protein